MKMKTTLARLASFTVLSLGYVFVLGDLLSQLLSPADFHIFAVVQFLVTSVVIISTSDSRWKLTWPNILFWLVIGLISSVLATVISTMSLSDGVQRISNSASAFGLTGFFLNTLLGSFASAGWFLATSTYLISVFWLNPRIHPSGK